MFAIPVSEEAQMSWLCVSVKSHGLSEYINWPCVLVSIHGLSEYKSNASYCTYNTAFYNSEFINECCLLTMEVASFSAVSVDF
jgi:hypothetical protein